MPHKPNLTPYNPVGWSDKIVVSNTTGTNTDSNLVEGDFLYLDLSVINENVLSNDFADDIETSFTISMYVDSEKIYTWNVATLPIDYIASFDDYPLGVLTKGSHSIEIRADYENRIKEYSENDNNYIKSIYITQSTPVTYIVTPTAGSNGNINPSSAQTVNKGSSISLTVNANTNYHIASVFGCGIDYANHNNSIKSHTLTTSPINSSCTVSATFAINNKYTVTPTAGANGSISPSVPQSVYFNNTVTFTVTPSVGYHASTVTGCGGHLIGNIYTTGPITSNCVVTATFSEDIMPVSLLHLLLLKPKLYDLSVTLLGNGAGLVESSPEGISCGADCKENYESATEVTLTATPGNASNFKGWSGGACSGRETCVVLIDKVKSVTASFALIVDCNGDPGGTAYLDNCGTCVGGNTGLTACIQDCTGTWGGTATPDNCSVCDANPANDNTTCSQDCNGDWGGTATTDNCGVCDSNSANDNTTCEQDCSGEWGGTAYLDNCGTCVGGNTGLTACVQDCTGVWGGTATTDNCSVCDANPANDNTTCAQDCNGEWGGSAYQDNCGTCVGGSTGISACAQDCTGDWGGTATTDNCGVCDSNPANDNATCSQDCNGDWGGTAYLDMCNNCVGGNTGNSPCYEEVTSLTGRIWLDRNLGASRVATSSIDSAAYGDLYQWGRLADGHEKRTSPTTTTISTTIIPGHNNFILTESSGPGCCSWLVPYDNSLWQGVDSNNNPCPSGFRVPTQAEWVTEKASWSSNDTVGAFASPLKLVAAGFRFNSNGSIADVNAGGHYWSSTYVNDTSAYWLAIWNAEAVVQYHARSSGRSVRCIKN